MIIFISQSESFFIFDERIIFCAKSEHGSEYCLSLTQQAQYEWVSQNS